MSDTRIEIIDLDKTPAIKYIYPGPFKRITYSVDSTGHIRLTITKILDLISYDVDFAKDISQVRRVQIKIFENFGGQDVLIRALNANFLNYMLDERAKSNGEIEREEIIIFEVTLIL